MTTELISRARAGDGAAFRELTEPYRRELLVHCYRMLGSLQDAEDALQDTLLPPGRPRGFEDAPRSAPGSTDRHQRCLNARRRPADPALEWDMPRLHRPSRPARRVVWLQPYPDALLEGAIDVPLGPEARYEQTEAISLAFVTALQALAPRQLAVLVLRDVLGFHANEVADMLDSTVEAVNSALKRGRASLQRRQPPTDEREPAAAPGATSEQALVAKFVRAYESADLDTLIALLTDDVRLSMPPIPLEYEGRDVGPAFASIFGSGRRVDLVPTRANGTGVRRLLRASTASAMEPACSSSPHRRPDLLLHPLRHSVLPWFGLPRSLPSR